ncbi:pantoate--beta-alanine ligase [Marivivens donghaensis]|uniref:pantoate--beta-alanine ligase n=1 Tax=Marivivens donghaensis TaxID=1699413 RepID=UPI00201EA95D|nr:pantoate--beta-alanine ligase [Marivivens donghaensis]MCL7409859.1 pantoate--beta-alanine ligase [Marivivens donghaensis]MDN3705294.1 pantoate--beta-alanine ligase [Marivivens donghaensis]
MIICRTIAEVRAVVRDLRLSGQTVGFVPTMGALHAGHMSLVAAAKAENDAVITSIFVNPTQFGQQADLDKYPRTEEADCAMLEAAGVAAVFMPTVEIMYPDGAETIVETTKLANMLHGLVRPGHYRGVCTVVTKLFNIVGADRAYFGEKDYQQLQVIRRMARDLDVPTEVCGVPTVREADGLAMSSRNVRLTPEDRSAAVVLNRSLIAAETAARTGATVEAIAQTIRDTIETEPRARDPHVDIVQALTLAPVSGRPSGTIGIMISAAFGPVDDPVLLIDQREITL